MNGSPADAASGRGLPTGETESWEFLARLRVSQSKGCETSRLQDIFASRLAPDCASAPWVGFCAWPELTLRVDDSNRCVM